MVPETADFTIDMIDSNHPEVNDQYIKELFTILCDELRDAQEIITELQSVTDQQSISIEKLNELVAKLTPVTEEIEPKSV